jgi:NADPH:quinone reductase-like Zn-dependent oxidoreductase
MRAITQTQYGGPEVLGLAEVDEPTVGPDSVRVRVQAAGVNPVDFKIRQGHLKGAFPSYFPLVLGWDVCGVVEAAGPAVRGFAPGDEIVAYARKDYLQHGAYAERMSIPQRCLAHKPKRIDARAAAGLPLAGLTAWQALTEGVELKKGQTVLVHAASGGVGSFAVQLARWLGARVIGTASEANHDYLRSFGAEPVTYGQGLEDRVRKLAPQGVDAVVDLVGGAALASSPGLLRPGGRLTSIIDPGTVQKLGGRYVFVRPEATHLAKLAELVDEGQLQIEVARAYPLDQAADAHRLLETGHVRGKLVLEL